MFSGLEHSDKSETQVPLGQRMYSVELPSGALGSVVTHKPAGVSHDNSERWQVPSLHK